MKRKSLLFLLLMAMLAPLAMNGQTQNTVLSQNFDGNGFTISDNTYDARAWYTYNAGNGNNWDLYQAGSSYAHSGIYCMLYDYNSSYAADCYLVSEPFTVSAQMAELSVNLYEAVGISSYAETFEVFFVKASDVTNLSAVASATHYGAIASASYTNEGYNQVSGSVTNSALAGQSVRVVVHCTSAKDKFRLYIDDITVTETTEDACPKPTGLTASHVTNNSATLNWNGEAESYNVRYKIITADAPIFSDDFENDLSNWTTVDADGDGFNWASHINTGSANLTTHSGDGVAYSESYHNNESGSGGTALNPNNWLITPQVQLGGSVSFWAIGQDDEYFAEHFAIYVSTTGNNPTNFTQVSEEYIATSEYVKYSADLSEYSGMGYVAIRHFNVSDQFILNIDDFEIYGPSQWVTVNNVSGNSLDITGLTADTDYEFQVQADCGTDGESSWSASATFHTLDNCAVPYELEVANPIAPISTLNWTGVQEAYNVRYRSYTLGEPQEYVFEEGFEGGSMPEGWDNSIYTGSSWGVGTGTGHTSSSISATSTSATGNYNAYYYSSTKSNSAYLILPALDLSNASVATLTFNYVNPAWVGGHFALTVYYRINGGSWNQLEQYTTSQDTWTGKTVTLTGLADSYQVAFYVTSYNNDYGHGVGIDDVKITYTAPSINYGPWVTKTNVTSPLNITGLNPSTNYEWQVQGVNCDGNDGTTDWSALATFTTLEGYALEIKGYGNQQNRGGYYLIASPVGEVAPANVANMIPTDSQQGYDLYYFDHTQDNEWVNYKSGSNPGFGLIPGKGYLYANQNDVILFFSGQAFTNTNGEYTVDLTPYSATSVQGHNADFPGWNLVGNPFAVTAWLKGNRGFYTMSADCRFFASVESQHIEAMQGIFVVAGETEVDPTVTFTTDDPEDKSSMFTLNLSHGRNLIDRAIVRLDGGRQLPKLQFIQGSTKVYIPVDGQDYAIVSCEEMGAMPVSFKAEENGSYTLSLNSENVSFAYLHLIDNLTGKDVDLLETPSYSFEAKTTDYANRFKLVFATGDNSNDDNFAFFSNGSFVINNDGAATLQVIDVTGRILSSESINGCTNVNVNAAPGVYMLRLINGNNVKVQKVVVR